jgi:long-chain acyl-CoA synthetase
MSAARSFPERPALSIGARALFDYRTLARRTSALSASLSGSLGLRRGDRVGLAMINCPEYLEILFACWHAGLIAVPISARLHPREIGVIVEDCDASLLFATDALASTVADAVRPRRIMAAGSAEYAALLSSDPVPAAAVAPTDLAWIFYTSGTTGAPKGAMLSHRNLGAMAIGYLADVDFLTERDALLHLAATSHASGLFSLSHVAKGSNNVLSESGGFDPDEIARIIDTTPALSFFVPPTLLRRITDEPAVRSSNLDNIRTILVGAAPVPAADLRAGLAAFGPKLWNGYGQGESPCTITAMSQRMIAAAAAAGDDARLASVGIARTGIEVRIAAENDEPVSPGEVGEVLVRGETVMSGYWNRPEDSRQALRGGWLHTGDLGCMNDEGFLNLLDRKKDLIISGGMNIYAREIEEILLGHPDLLEVAVVGLPDPQWGESVAAIVVPAADRRVDTADLDRLCLEKIARYKRPKRYEFVTELPRNPAGKVLKRELRDRFADKKGRA